MDLDKVAPTLTCHPLKPAPCDLFYFFGTGGEGRQNISRLCAFLSPSLPPSLPPNAAGIDAAAAAAFLQKAADSETQNVARRTCMAPFA